MEIPSSTFTRKRHLIIKNDATELGRWLDREFPVSLGLFVYFHLQTGNYVVAQWVGVGKFCDVINAGPVIQRFGHDRAVELRRRLYKPTNRQEMHRDLKDRDYRQRRNEADESWIDHETKRVKRKIQILVP